MREIKASAVMSFLLGGITSEKAAHRWYCAQFTSSLDGLAHSGEALSSGRRGWVAGERVV